MHRTDGPAIEHTNSTKEWFQNDQRHRTDGPAMEFISGHKEWYLNGKWLKEKEFLDLIGEENRTDTTPVVATLVDTTSTNLATPTVASPTSVAESTLEILTTKRWTNSKGELHRTDGPAVEYPHGTKCWYENGLYHRTDGPAIENSDGTKQWYQNGRRHRTDGPAIENVSGAKTWYLDGHQFTEAEFIQATRKQ